MSHLQKRGSQSSLFPFKSTHSLHIARVVEHTTRHLCWVLWVVVHLTRVVHATAAPLDRAVHLTHVLTVAATAARHAISVVVPATTIVVGITAALAHLLVYLL